MKHSTGVEFVANEEELLCEVAESIKRRKKSSDGDGSKMATSTGGLTTETGFLDMDDMAYQGHSMSLLLVPLFVRASVGCELPPREEIIGKVNVCQRSKYYPSQSAKTLLKDFFEVNPPKFLDAGRTTTFLSADQKIQFARGVGLEVTLISYGLVEDLLVRSRGVGAVNARGVTGNSHFPSLVGSIRGDSIASHSPYSPLTGTGLTGVPGCENGFVVLLLPDNKPCTSRTVDFGETIDLEHIPRLF